MINANSIWIGNENQMQIDIRSHLLHKAGTLSDGVLTGNVLLQSESEWYAGDRVVEVGARRFDHAEQILKSVADCLVDSVLVEATAQGVEVNSVSASIEAATEPLARPGVLNRLRSGPSRLEVVLKVVANATDEEIGHLVVAARRSSPAFDLVATGVRVEVSRHDG